MSCFLNRFSSKFIDLIISKYRTYWHGDVKTLQTGFRFGSNLKCDVFSFTFSFDMSLNAFIRKSAERNSDYMCAQCPLLGVVCIAIACSVVVVLVSVYAFSSLHSHIHTSTRHQAFGVLKRQCSCCWRLNFSQCNFLCAPLLFLVIWFYNISADSFVHCMWKSTFCSLKIVFCVKEKCESRN